MIARSSCRFLCPRCRTSIDACRVEVGHDGARQFAVCPECDEVVVLGAQAFETVLPSDETQGVMACEPGEFLLEKEVSHV